uniref:ATP synthase F0 subunit 8 n=2 Tax=Rhynchium TaxID=522435 RepID=A0A6M9AUT6_9HYME|nr:ATP synthase F0 subunit 8 [Rhynchium aff. brunneum YN]YP_009859768.1 ATP synthase F0 subunit 8 [Rhynchium aff. brunneum GX]QKK69327.1 ATP synthase F0 subunit 8 [Rhynchium aff. brunneum YN]QKK69340.1 ATP synthase F0 subunit 8 [Rhynchium aff. brunneum GX]
MPHLSPLKWLNMYMFLIIWMLIFIVKMNFMMHFNPDKKKIKIFDKQMNWKIL